MRKREKLHRIEAFKYNSVKFDCNKVENKYFYNYCDYAGTIDERRSSYRSSNNCTMYNNYIALTIHKGCEYNKHCIYDLVLGDIVRLYGNVLCEIVSLSLIDGCDDTIIIGCKKIKNGQNYILEDLENENA